MFLYIFKIIIKLIMTSSRFDPGSTSVRPQKPWTSSFYGSMNGPGLKTLPIMVAVSKSTRSLIVVVFKTIGKKTQL